MAKFDPRKTPGSFGAPPAHAPQEVTLPGSERPTADQLREARANEQDLPTYAPKPMSDEAAAAYLGKSVEEIRTERARLANFMASSAIVLTDAPTVATPATSATPLVAPVATITPAVSKLRRVIKPRPDVNSYVPQGDAHDPLAGVSQPVSMRAAAPALQGSHVDAGTLPGLHADHGALVSTAVGEDLDSGAAGHLQETAAPAVVDPFPIQPHMRAASNSDSPARGVPTAIADRGKQITGGFGDVGEAQYFPLDGTEVRRVVERELAIIRKRIRDDLRFSMAATYPRVTVEVSVTVSCFAADQTFQIIRKPPPHAKTPIDVARDHADECVFVIVSQREEMTPSGESIDPPDKIRHELGLTIPRKQSVKTPGGRILVDVKQ